MPIREPKSKPTTPRPPKPKPQTPAKKVIEIILNEFNDLREGTDEEVRKDLVDMGVDVDKESIKFKETLKIAKKNLISKKMNELGVTEDWLNKPLLILDGFSPQELMNDGKEQMVIDLFYEIIANGFSV